MTVPHTYQGSGHGPKIEPFLVLDGSAAASAQDFDISIAADAPRQAAGVGPIRSTILASALVYAIAGTPNLTASFSLPTMGPIAFEISEVRPDDGGTSAFSEEVSKLLGDLAAGKLATPDISDSATAAFMARPRMTPEEVAASRKALAAQIDS